ncbi:hypothetical protein RchiOBHm_Chr3g0495231 [Rosa chinensis]|uniref:Uncharacterized protein n=1 Tax=Rosa chinensis TaxID=74649 RepID=A0A2P6RH66_ROSCH|nr:hypothetical protein RchiOBHm_Chr3g0495231 [Rosa chinensis]
MVVSCRKLIHTMLCWSNYIMQPDYYLHFLCSVTVLLNIVYFVYIRLQFLFRLSGCIVSLIVSSTIAEGGPFASKTSYVKYCSHCGCLHPNLVYHRTTCAFII